MEGLKRVVVDGSWFFVREGTCDEAVLNADYQVERGAGRTYVPRTGDLVIDAGAHIGSFAIPLAKCCTELRIIALEPDLANFELLDLNVALNGLNNVRAIRYALAGKPGIMPLFAGADSWGHTTDPDAYDGSHGAAQSVPAIDLAHLMAEFGIERISLLKLNIEGAEYDVLLNASRAILARIDRVWAEYHPHRRYRGPVLAQRLAATGFRVQSRTSPDDGKGWIDAIRQSPYDSAPSRCPDDSIRNEE
jgi:FkbM family methyltransferase